jgi:hypothetical protein
MDAGGRVIQEHTEAVVRSNRFGRAIQNKGLQC